VLLGVEKSTKLIKLTATGKRMTRVEVAKDKIAYMHEQFVGR